jgi:hypothetical protein
MELSDRSSELIQGIAAVGGLVYERFSSAAGIEGNLKIHFIEALHELPLLKRHVVICMTEALEGVEFVTGVPSGGLELAEDIAKELAVPLITIQKYHRNSETPRYKRNGFHIIREAKERLAEFTKAGYVEDVTSTNSSLLKLSNHPYLQGKQAVSVVGLRRGVTAPAGVSRNYIEHTNRLFAFKPPIEYPLPFTVHAVVERPLPLWVPLHKQISSYLLELKQMETF